MSLASENSSEQLALVSNVQGSESNQGVNSQSHPIFSGPRRAPTPSKVPKIIDNKVYAFVRFENGKTSSKIVVAECLLCPESTKPNTVKGDTNTQSNFVKHLKRKHPGAYEEHENSKTPAPIKSQPTLNHLRTGVTYSHQARVDRAIMRYVINGMKALSTVDAEDFVQLIKDASGETSVKVMSRRSLCDRVENGHAEIMETLVKKLSQPTYICLTADAWSAHSRAFLGVTAHWVSPKYERESAVLACSRFRGSHTYDRITNELNLVIARFNIPKEKIVSIVTDNGSNFVKAFKEFGISSHYETLENPCDSDTDDDEEDVGISKPTMEESFIEIDGILKERRLLHLPPHFKCASHTLSLVATKDILMASDKAFYHKVLGRCTKLWNLSSSPKSAEIIIKSCGKNFKRPCPTRWNSMFDAILRLLEMQKGLKTVCDELNVPELREKELQFLEEFKNVSKPIACALDLLQGEYGLFMGMTLPVLSNMRKMISYLKGSTKLCEQFVDSCLKGIDKRFGEILEVDPEHPSDLVYAAMSHPAYKLRWISAEFHVPLRLHFQKACEKYASNGGVAVSDTDNSFMMFENPLLDFSSVVQNISTEPNVTYSVELEVIRYFNDTRCNLEMLNDYPSIRNVFYRYNTALPSSAPVERLFSMAGMILSPKRCALIDKRFEMLVLLKCNSKFGIFG